MPSPTVIGHITIHQPKCVTQHYETAAWETTIEAPAGAYPVVAYFEYGKDTDTAYVQYSGPIVDNYMPTLFCGVRVPGGKDGSEEVGNIRRVSQSISPTSGIHLMSVMRDDVKWENNVEQVPGLPWRIRRKREAI